MSARSNIMRLDYIDYIMANVCYVQTIHCEPIGTTGNQQTPQSIPAATTRCALRYKSVERPQRKSCARAQGKRQIYPRMRDNTNLENPAMKIQARMVDSLLPSASFLKALRSLAAFFFSQKVSHSFFFVNFILLFPLLSISAPSKHSSLVEQSWRFVGSG